MDNSNKLGSHWVAMFAPSKDKVYYYDSYGIKPWNSKISKYLRRFKTIIPNKITFQSLVSEVCGYYVIYFIYMCSLGKSLRYITRILNAAKPRVDLYVYKYVHNNII